MKIDEAIAHERRLAVGYRNDIQILKNVGANISSITSVTKQMEYHEQLAEWLEDYKQIKMLIPIEKALKSEYNNAIDDLMEKVSECFISDADWNYLLQESEQLKEGDAK